MKRIILLIAVLTFVAGSGLRAQEQNVVHHERGEDLQTSLVLSQRFCIIF